MDLADCVELDGVQPNRVVRPASVEEVSAELHDAHRRSLRVSPVGGATHFEIGHSLEKIDVALSLGGLSAVAAYEPDDLTISVQAGMTATALEDLLAQHGRTLFLDVAEADRATIGGMVAIGHSGPRRFAYGSLRDRLIGARAVLADGTIVKTGGMVVKNVAGYDLTKLLHGSLGSIAVITQLNFKLAALPAAQSVLEYRLPDATGAASVLEAMLATRLPYAALVAASDGSLRAGCEGHPADVARLQAEFEDAARRAGGTKISEVSGARESSGAWCEFLRSQIAAHSVTFRIGSLPSAVGATALGAQAFASEAGFEASWSADAGCGAVDLHVDAGDRSDALVKLERALIGAHLSVRVMRCPPRLRAGLAVFGRAPQGLALMRALKMQFDPNGVLNVGRNVGRI
jgi:glycolate dehydrogenase FAD-binding subunit